MKVTTVNVNDLDIYFKLLKHEDRLKMNLHWLVRLKEMEIDVMKRVKADAQFLEAYVHGGNTAKFIDPLVKKKLHSIMLNHMQVEKVISKLDKELADQLAADYKEEENGKGMDMP